MNPTVALTLILLTLMIGAGFVSGSWGYQLGREALKGIRQPDVRPGGMATDDTSTPPRREEVPILREADILADVKARMEGRSREFQANRNTSIAQTPSPTASATVSASPSESSSPVAYAPSDQFPLSSNNGGVTLQVRSVRQENGSLVIDVSLQNSAAQPVKFLYSFMSVTDNQGRSFSANADGLPGELPANSSEFAGTISIPIALLDGSDDLSLTLTDYPDQQVQLQISGIPVVR